LYSFYQPTRIIMEHLALGQTTSNCQIAQETATKATFKLLADF